MKEKRNEKQEKVHRKSGKKSFMIPKIKSVEITVQNALTSCNPDDSGAYENSNVCNNPYNY